MPADSKPNLTISILACFRSVYVLSAFLWYANVAHERSWQCCCCCIYVAHNFFEPTTAPDARTKADGTTTDEFDDNILADWVSGLYEYWWTSWRKENPANAYSTHISHLQRNWSGSTTATLVAPERCVLAGVLFFHSHNSLPYAYTKLTVNKLVWELFTAEKPEQSTTIDFFIRL